MKKNNNFFTNGGGFKMLLVAIFFDLASALVAGIGWALTLAVLTAPLAFGAVIMSKIVSAAGTYTFWVWSKLAGVNFQNKLVWAAVVEVFPYIDIVPSFSVMVIAAWMAEKAKNKLKNVPGASTVANKGAENKNPTPVTA